jgi:excisionase family DNA binding protein
VSAINQLPVVQHSSRAVRRNILALQIERNLAQRATLTADPLMPLRDAQIVLGCSYTHIRALIAQKKLPVFRIGRGWMKVRLSALQALLAEGDRRQETS